MELTNTLDVKGYKILNSRGDGDCSLWSLIFGFYVNRFDLTMSRIGKWIHKCEPTTDITTPINFLIATRKYFGGSVLKPEMSIQTIRESKNLRVLTKERCGTSIMTETDYELFLSYIDTEDKIKKGRNDIIGEWVFKLFSYLCDVSIFVISHNYINETRLIDFSLLTGEATPDMILADLPYSTFTYTMTDESIGSLYIYQSTGHYSPIVSNTFLVSYVPTYRIFDDESGILATHILHKMWEDITDKPELIRLI
jgi:hypothetical protein